MMDIFLAGVFNKKFSFLVGDVIVFIVGDFIVFIVGNFIPFSKSEFHTYIGQFVTDCDLK